MVQVAPGRRLGITGNPDYDGQPFTDFAAVNEETDVTQLNLNWAERDLPEHVRTKHVHRLHPYLGKFVPQLVEIFLRKYRPSRVLDPFVGSGTTLVEAAALGIDAVGCDISSFNCLLSRVKTAEYDVAKLEREVEDILHRMTAAAQLALPGFVRESESYLFRWYAPKAREQLFLFRSLIPDYTYQDLLKVILCRAARSARLTTHFDLDFPKIPVLGEYWCHKHRRMCCPTDEALKFLRRYAMDALRRVSEFASIRRPADIQVLQGDARSARFPDCDLVVTSPPYIGLIDYHEQHRYAYELLNLPERRAEEIGAAWKGNSEKAAREYVQDMTAVFENVGLALSPGDRIVVVVHDRRNLYEGIGNRLGFELEYRLKRHVNRRTGRRATDFFEDVIVWRRR